MSRLKKQMRLWFLLLVPSIICLCFRGLFVLISLHRLYRYLINSCTLISIILILLLCCRQMRCWISMVPRVSIEWLRNRWIKKLGNIRMLLQGDYKQPRKKSSHCLWGVIVGNILYNGRFIRLYVLLLLGLCVFYFHVFSKE